MDKKQRSGKRAGKCHRTTTTTKTTHYSHYMSTSDQATTSMHVDVSAIFTSIDRNKDGRLTFSDLRMGFKDMGIDISDHDLKTMMNEVNRLCRPLR
eukprot:sb/3479197/